MKKYILIALALLIPAVAYAASNIRQQQSTGSAVWVHRDGTTSAAGDTGIVLAMSDMSSSGTRYAVVPKSGYVRAVYSVLNGVIAGETGLHVAHNRTGAMSSTSIRVTIADLSTEGTVDSATDVTANGDSRVEKGNVIAIVGDGGATAAVQATITIVIE